MVVLTEKEFDKTFSSKFVNVTETALNFNEKEFDDYINKNLYNELGSMFIKFIYETSDDKWRHVIFETDKKNIQYIVVLNLSNRSIYGHHVLDLNKKYGLDSQ